MVRLPVECMHKFSPFILERMDELCEYIFIEPVQRKLAKCKHFNQSKGKSHFVGLNHSEWQIHENEFSNKYTPNEVKFVRIGGVFLFAVLPIFLLVYSVEIIHLVRTHNVLNV